jgi:hypothetical protein
MADRFAVALSVHPADLWPDWFDRAEAEAGEYEPDLVDAGLIAVQVKVGPPKEVFVDRARKAKVAKMLPVLRELGTTPQAAARMTPPQRRAVAGLGGCRVPSDATWALVVDALKSTD